jgi:hypothetical protein
MFSMSTLDSQSYDFDFVIMCMSHGLMFKGEYQSFYDCVFFTNNEIGPNSK